MSLDVAMGAALAVVLLRWGILVTLAHLRGRVRTDPADGPDVTVIVPAYQEADALVATVAGALASRRVGQVIVVDDGSTDGTGAIASRLAACDPRVVALSHTVNRGKAAALNTGLCVADTAIIVTLDADTVPEPTAIARLATALEEEGVAAAACNVKVAASAGWLVACQAVEYVTAIHLGRRAQAALGAMTTVPGALAAWRADALRAVGGVPGDTLAEDTDLTLTLQRAGHRVVFVDDAIAYTRTPRTLAALFRQRRRWLHGNLQCAVKHARGLRDGPPGLRWLALPDLWFTHLGVYLLLPISLAWLAHAPAHFSTAALLALGAALFTLDLLGSALALHVDRAPLRGLWHVPLQRLVWPFLLWAVFADVVARRLRGAPIHWGRVRARAAGP